METTNAPALRPSRPGRRLTVDELNARTSARQVRRFLSGRVKRDVGYLKADTMDDRSTPLGPNRIRYSVTTWTGDVLLPWVAATKTRAPGIDGWRHERWYFSGKDARGRVWHGTSPGVGMYARLHLNKRQGGFRFKFSPDMCPGFPCGKDCDHVAKLPANWRRKRPPTRAALLRNIDRLELKVADAESRRENVAARMNHFARAFGAARIPSATLPTYELASTFSAFALNNGAAAASIVSPDGGRSFVVSMTWRA